MHFLNDFGEATNQKKHPINSHDPHDPIATVLNPPQLLKYGENTRKLRIY